MALPFRAESSSLVMYPCRLSELFVTPELWYLWLSGSGEADFNLFHGRYLVLQLICCDVFGHFIGLFAICAIVAFMDVVYVFLLCNDVAYVSVGINCIVTGETCGFTRILPFPFRVYCLTN